VPLTADNWPIAASLLPFAPSAVPDRWDSATEHEWTSVFTAVKAAGFDDVDLTDTWMRFGDLNPEQVGGLAQVLDSVGLGVPSASVIRRSVTDEIDGDAHLAYSHRCLEVAAQLGVGVVSVGLHRPLTEEQRRQLWFWTVVGHRDPIDDPATWALAVARFRELGKHAADLGILLSLELYEHTYLGTAASAVRLVEEIDLPEVGLNPDIGNLVRLHEPIEDWRDLVAATLPYANFWHVKNYTRDEGAGFVSAVPSYMESGLINYREAMAVALQSGFQGVICTEHYGGDGLSMAAANREYLRNRVLPRSDYALGESRVRQQYAVSVDLPS
jgi:sugar phosphate isomerase/epimerase